MICHSSFANWQVIFGDHLVINYQNHMFFYDYWYNILQHCKTVNHLNGKTLKVINSFAMLKILYLLIMLKMCDFRFIICIEITLICKKELQKVLDASILFGHVTKCSPICFTQSENSIWSCNISIHVINSFGAISDGGFLFELKISFRVCISYEWYRKVFSVLLNDRM